jgi:hypothetical protein
LAADTAERIVMSLAGKQRDALIAERGEPALRLEFDVFADGQVSMWTHFQHGDDFAANKRRLIKVRDHLTEFINDEAMCPFQKSVEQKEQVQK